MNEVFDEDRLFVVSPADIKLINRNSETAPILRSRKDLELNRKIYKNHSVLVDRSGTPPSSVWPIKYTCLFHMANDSGKFLDVAKLEKLGAYPIGLNIWRKGSIEYLPLYEGKMVQAFDHRAADIVLAEKNLFRTGQGQNLTALQHNDPNRLSAPRYWVQSENVEWTPKTEWCLSIKDVTSVTNARTTIAAVIPHVAAGHTLPVIFPAITQSDEKLERPYSDFAILILANLNSVLFDYLARQKVHGNHLAWYLIEQLPVLDDPAYNTKFGKKLASDIVRASVLELTYTAHDLAPFARDLGYVDKAGNVKPPFPWDEDRRLKLRAKLDALYFQLYDVTERDDVRYIYSTFPIVEREEIATHGRYRSRDLCLAYMSALEAGDPDAEINL
jgi:hypothetical protein